MTDPFSGALDALFASPMAASATYQTQDGQPSAIRAIRSRPSVELGEVLVDTEIVEIRRSEVPEPERGALLTFADSTSFIMQGAARLDVEGLTWTVGIVPA